MGFSLELHFGLLTSQYLDIALSLLISGWGEKREPGIDHLRMCHFFLEFGENVLSELKPKVKL